MAMRETIRSLRIYFFIVSLIMGTAALAGLNGQGGTLPKEIAIVGMLFALSYLIIAIKLESFLANKLTFVYSTLAATAILAGVVFWRESSAGRVSGILPFGIKLLIMWYLYKNIKRLSTEQGKPSIKPSSNQNPE